MPMSVRFNPNELEISIRNIAEVAGKNAAAAMRKTAIRIRNLARDYAPYKSGTLEDAINYAAIKDPASRRNIYVIYVDTDMMRPPSSPNGSPTPVGDYAWPMEKDLRPYGAGVTFKKLGTLSKIKRDGGKKVGGRFLQRAVKDGTADLLRDATNEVRRTLSGGRLMPTAYQRDIGGDEE